MTKTVARCPGSIPARSVSRKLPIAYQCSVSMIVNSGWPVAANSPAAISSAVIRPSQGARTTVLFRSRSARASVARAPSSSASVGLVLVMAWRASSACSRACCSAIGALRRARLVDLLGGDKAGPEQRLHPPQCARSERPLRLGTDDAARGGICLGGLCRDLVGGQGEPCLQALYRRTSLVHAHSVRVRVDPEQHVALAYRLVVADVELYDPAADVGRQVNEVGL